MTFRDAEINECGRSVRWRSVDSRILWIATLLGLVLSWGAEAREVYWVGGSGVWSDPAHWSDGSGGAGPATAPGPGDDAIIDAGSGAGAYTVTLDGDVTVRDLRVAGDASPQLALSFGSATLECLRDCLFGVGRFDQGEASRLLVGRNLDTAMVEFNWLNEGQLSIHMLGTGAWRYTVVQLGLAGQPDNVPRIWNLVAAQDGQTTTLRPVGDGPSSGLFDIEVRNQVRLGDATARLTRDVSEATGADPGVALEIRSAEDRTDIVASGARVELDAIEHEMDAGLGELGTDAEFLTLDIYDVTGAYRGAAGTGPRWQLQGPLTLPDTRLAIEKTAVFETGGHDLVLGQLFVGTGSDGAGEIHLGSSIVTVTDRVEIGNAAERTGFLRLQSGALEASLLRIGSGGGWVSGEAGTVLELLATTEPPPTAFYVSSSEGSDQNDGLSPGSAWASVERGIAALGAGVHVFLKRGDRWMLADGTVLAGGAGGAVGAYGAGARPVIQVGESGGVLELTQGRWELYDVRIEFGSAAPPPPDPPPPPGSTAQLLWLAGAEPDLAGYRVYASTLGGGPYTQIADLGFVAPDPNGQASQTLSLDRSVDRFLVMTAYDTAGNESLYSNELFLSAGPGDPNDPAPPPPPPECTSDGDCDDGDACNGVERCSSGSCAPGTPPSCTPGVCELASCDPQLGCVVEPDPACQGPPPCSADSECDDGDVCNGLERCLQTGCVEGTPAVCSPGGNCTEAACDPLTGCFVTPLPDDSPCSDGDPTTRGDACFDGICVGFECAVNDDCVDATDCTVDSCDPFTRSCSHAPDDATCQNGILCDGFEICDPASGCTAGIDPCGAGSCDEEQQVCWAIEEILLEELQIGWASDSATVSTTAPLTAMDEDLYLATVSYKPAAEVLGMTGLGLEWIEISTQCSGRSQTGISVWMGQGTPSTDGVVSVALSRVPRNAVLAVTRYSGAAGIGEVASGNTNGIAGVCEAGQDGIAYALELPVWQTGSTVLGAVAHRNKRHEPGPGYEELLELAAGSGGDVAGVAIQTRDVGEPADEVVEGVMSGDVDWAAIAVEIVAEAVSYLP